MDANSRDLRDFERSLRARNRSRRTIENYTESARALAAFHPDRALVALQRGDIEAYLADVLATRSPSTAATRYRCLQQFYRWTVDEELIETSPMAGLRPPEIPEKPVRVLSDEEIKALLRASDGREFTDRRDTALWRLMLEPGGLRLAEVTGLALADVDLDTDVVLVLGKGGRPRAVPFGAKTGTALTRYLRVRDAHPQADSRWLWLGAKGRLSDSGITQALRRRAKAAGIGHVHPHALRHTAAHRWLAAGGSGEDALRLFGWRSREMLSRYAASTADSRAREAARRLAVGDQF